MKRHVLSLLAILLALASLATLAAVEAAPQPHHFFRFTAGTPGSPVRSGTLRYERDKLVITGAASLRTTYSGDFVFLFTDKTGNKLVELQQDQSFARIGGRLIGMTWEGETRSAPSNLKGWLSLSPLFVNQVIPKSVKKSNATENFEFRFPAKPSSDHLGF